MALFKPGVGTDPRVDVRGGSRGRDQWLWKEKRMAGVHRGTGFCGGILRPGFYLSEEVLPHSTVWVLCTNQNSFE